MTAHPGGSIKRIFWLISFALLVAIVWRGFAPSTQPDLKSQAANDQDSAGVLTTASTSPEEMPPTATRSTPPEAASARPARSRVNLPAPPDVSREQRQVAESQRIRSLGQEFRIGNEDYELLSIRALPKAEYGGPASKVLFERLGFVFFDGAQHQGLHVDGTFPVVSRKSNGLLGVITGTLIVTLKDFRSGSSIAQSYGLRTKFSDESLNTVYLAAPLSASLSDLAGALKADPSVESVTIEVVQTQKVF